MNRGRLRFALGRAYMPGMDRDYWTKELCEAEAELAAAKRRTELNAAAKRLQPAKTELKGLETEAAERPSSSPRRGTEGRQGLGQVAVHQRGADDRPAARLTGAA